MFIVNAAQTRAEYKRRWQLLARAKQKGLNIDLLDEFYQKMLERGYSQETTRAAMLYAAKNGVFGFLNTWER